jgi:hypothetical protein
MKSKSVNKEIKLNNEAVKLNITFKAVKNINMRVRDGEIFVSAPPSVSISYIEKLLQSRAESILSSVKKTKKSYSYDSVKLLGEDLPLRIICSGKTGYEFTGSELILYTDDENNSEKNDYIINEWYKKMSPYYFTESLERIYPIIKPFGVPKPELVYQAMKTRWGVCFYTKNKVKMNINLLKYPKGCIDQVMLHELIHFLCHNHGKDFYAYMDMLMPDWRVWNEILKG